METQFKPTDSELQQMFMNAIKTAASCGGHKKAKRNENRAQQIKKELEKRGAHVPEKLWCLEHGIFNGCGAS